MAIKGVQEFPYRWHANSNWNHTRSTTTLASC